MRGELLGQFERGIGDDGFTSARQLLHEEVAPVEVRRVAVVNEIRGKDLMSGCAERPHDCAAATCRLPQALRQALDSQQRLDGNGRRFVEVVTPLDE